jgi:uncharacterized protein (TIGR03067 family)
MTMHPTLLILAGLLMAGDHPRGRDTDVARVQGPWVLTSLMIDGQVAEETEIMGSRLVVECERGQALIEGVTLEGTIRLDPTGTPNTIDVTFREGPNAGLTVRGIYKLEQDRFTVCRAQRPGGKRPAEFAAPPGSRSVLMVWEREEAR